MNPPPTGEGARPQGSGWASPKALSPMVQRARQARNSMSIPEVLLWRQLRQRPNGLKFHCQHPMGPYAVDFCCLAPRLAVNVGGFAHASGNRAGRNAIKTQFLNNNGYKVTRVSAAHVLADAIGAAEAIAVGRAKPLHHPAGSPPLRAGEN